MPESRIELVVHGRVQGVAYRDWTRRQAACLGLRGYARNLDDGTVEVVAEGPADALDQLVERCRSGPRLAAVTRVDVARGTPQGRFSGFAIL